MKPGIYRRLIEFLPRLTVSKTVPKNEFFEVDDKGCWLWKGLVSWGGYGRFSEGRKIRLAHRFFYESLVGKIPDGLHIDHLCRTRNCVNPRHMEPVTLVENIMRGVGVGAKNKVKTHCKRGHALVPGNIYTNKCRPNERRCRECGMADCRKRNNRNYVPVSRRK